MRGKYSLTATAIVLAALSAGCSMNKKSTINPMPYVREDWNENVKPMPEVEEDLFDFNQFFVKDGITFHDYAQRDMGLNPGEVWYPTYDMANRANAPTE